MEAIERVLESVIFIQFDDPSVLAGRGEAALRLCEGDGVRRCSNESSRHERRAALRQQRLGVGAQFRLHGGAKQEGGAWLCVSSLQTSRPYAVRRHARISGGRQGLEDLARVIGAREGAGDMGKAAQHKGRFLRRIGQKYDSESRNPLNYMASPRRKPRVAPQTTTGRAAWALAPLAIGG